MVYIDKTAGLIAAGRMLERCGKTTSQAYLLQYAMEKAPTHSVTRGAYLNGLKRKTPALSQLSSDYLQNRNALDELLKPTAQTDLESPSYVPIRDRLCYILHNALPYASGGYATRAHGIAQGLKKQGFDVVCVTRPGFPIDLPGYEEHSLEETKNCVDDIRYHHLLSISRKDYSHWEYIKHATEALVAKLRVLRPEVIIAASNNLTALPALLAARRLGVSFQYEIRGFWEITRLSREPEFIKTKTYANQKRLEIMASKAADHVFTLTKPMKDELIQRGVDEADITLVPNSCDPDQFMPKLRDSNLAAHYNIPDGIPVIGYVGTFVQYEGLDDLVKACSILHEEGQDFRLLLVGNENAAGQEKGPLMTEITRLTQENGFNEKIIMPGRIPHEDVAAHYSLIDIAPFPRKPQPVTEMVSPMKPLEALAMEKAVIVSSVRALVEMVKDGETGLVFEKGNVADMARVLKQLINMPELRQHLGQNGRRWVTTERTWDRTTHIFAKELRRQITRRRQVPSQAAII